MEHTHDVGDERWYSDCPACRLEEAAPALLEAIKWLVTDVQDYEAWQRPCAALDAAKAAIALAEKGD